MYGFRGGLLLPLTESRLLWLHRRRTESMGLNFAERFVVKKAISHLLSHWPAHLVWIFPVVAFLIPSLKAYEVAHPGAIASQVIGEFLIVIARYVAPFVGTGASQ